MQIYQQKHIPTFSTTNSNKNSFSPTFTDSKSSVNLWESFEQAHKHCQANTYPKTPISTNRQFLRHTVNINTSELTSITSQISTYQNNKNKHQNIFYQKPKSATDLQEYSTNCTKIICQDQKRNSNPEKKQGVPSKQNIIPKFLEKKLQLIDKINTGISKTEKAGTGNSEIKALQKKTFTPKPTKIVENKNLRNISEIPFCPSQYLQKKFSNSPTRKQSLSHGCFKEPKITDFKKLKFLGEGRFGQVHLVVHLETNFLYALKQIKKECIRKNKMEDQLLMEIKMQSYLNHPNILKLYGVFNDENNIYLILQFMQQGTLYSQLKKLKKIPQDQAARKLKDVLDGVNYLHQHKIAHRDIKPQNIVISHDVPKLCDLGWAAICEDRRKTLCGTIDYASPEVLQGKQYGIAIDLWCLGVLCYELMVGKCPFYHTSHKETMKKIINSDQSDLNLPQNLTNESKNFIEKLLLKNPEERMSTTEALNHPLILLHHDKQLQELKSSPNKKF